jgi:L-alanine-DL-glutamate epimerase-like enolase superfamily enzyme
MNSPVRSRTDSRTDIAGLGEEALPGGEREDHALNTLAELHVAAAARNVLDGCECIGPTRLSNDVVGRPLAMEVGSVPVPMLPGLGAELGEEALTRWDCTRRPASS